MQPQIIDEENEWIEPFTGAILPVNHVLIRQDLEPLLFTLFQQAPQTRRERIVYTLQYWYWRLIRSSLQQLRTAVRDFRK
jgi:hypothetical protein